VPWTSAARLTLGHAVHGTRRLLAARSDRVPLLEELGECRTRARRDRVLQRLGEVGKGGVRVDRLQVPDKLVWGARPEPDLSAATASSTAEKITDCMTSVAALGMAGLNSCPVDLGSTRP
jgi:hypothetical protein